MKRAILKILAHTSMFKHGEFHLTIDLLNLNI